MTPNCTSSAQWVTGEVENPISEKENFKYSRQLIIIAYIYMYLITVPRYLGTVVVDRNGRI